MASTNHSELLSRVNARNQMKQTIEAMGVHCDLAKNGQEAWTRLDAMAGAAVNAGERIADVMPVVITDLKMPEIGADGFLAKFKAPEVYRTLSAVFRQALVSEPVAV